MSLCCTVVLFGYVVLSGCVIQVISQVLTYNHRLLFISTSPPYKLHKYFLVVIHPTVLHKFSPCELCHASLGKSFPTHICDYTGSLKDLKTESFQYSDHQMLCPSQSECIRIITAIFEHLPSSPFALMCFDVHCCVRMHIEIRIWCHL